MYTTRNCIHIGVMRNCNWTGVEINGRGISLAITVQTEKNEDCNKTAGSVENKFCALSSSFSSAKLKYCS